MKLTRTAVQLYRRVAGPVRSRAMRSAVSLHGHSECSREKLDFLPGIARRIPVVADLFERSVAHYERVHGHPLDFSQAYWRPPLSPPEVIASERDQIQRRFDCEALVSLTDHDTLEGPCALRAIGRTDVPLSIEWSVPFEGTVFHLGVHAIAPSRHEEAERALAAYTAGATGDLPELLDWLCECPETFIVLNHPYWDLGGIGPMRHDSTLLTFLRTHQDRIHALELNGYRSWTENRRVLPLAEGFGVPLVGGGDRHGLVPNAILNLTSASSLAEFARDLRAGHATCCVLLPEYEEPFAARVLQTAAGVLGDLPRHHSGRCRWSERVFMTVDGEERSLESIWIGVSWWLRSSIAITRALGSARLCRLHELMRVDRRETLEADCCSNPPPDPVPLLGTPPPAAMV